MLFESELVAVSRMSLTGQGATLETLNEHGPIGDSEDLDHFEAEP